MPEPITSPGDQGGDNSTTDAGQQAGSTAPPDDLGDAGKRAIAEERKARKAAEQRLSELEKELNSVRESTMSETEKAIAKAKREAQAEAMKSFNTRLVQAEVRAAAAGKLADPEDAIRFLDLGAFAVDEDGHVEKKAIEKELNDLLKAKPYLAAGATRPTGDADQGARGGPTGGSMNEIIRRAVGR